MENSWAAKQGTGAAEMIACWHLARPKIGAGEPWGAARPQHSEQKLKLQPLPGVGHGEVALLWDLGQATLRIPDRCGARGHWILGPLHIELNKGYTQTVVPTWQLRPEALSDAPFEGAVRDRLMQYFDINWGTSTTRGCDCEAKKVVIRGLCMQTTYSVRHQCEKDVLDHIVKLRDQEKCLPTQPHRMEESRQTRWSLLDDWRRLE
ncbi:hypothetical protein NDU88_006631 [Pleurodeles waltl]|uniref:Uncharacterized protein n=1 Tax=Pleurodeles waltl TaxID=8319 RepID=A0AAV7X4B4_PLEWA|nr:hypothetical protein NDU88_006631 [Pleurodeles waltl]